MIKITFDPAKRDMTLAQRGLDFADSGEVFAGTVFEQQDRRIDYGEPRFITVGYLRGRMVVVVWTPREGVHHIISMRKANKREQKRFKSKLD
jgi:uncharacterized DUF497 family protein